MQNQFTMTYQSKDELMKAINLPKPEYEDDKKDFIVEFKFVFDDRGFAFEGIMDNDDDYLQTMKLKLKVFNKILLRKCLPLLIFG